MEMLICSVKLISRRRLAVYFFPKTKYFRRKKGNKMTEEANFVEQIENNHNKTNVRCQFCNSFMLKALEGKYCEQEIDVPLMVQKQDSKAESLNTETLRHFWQIDDMMTFENIGFSHTVDGRKFLVCADCERGPVGYHELSTKRCYLALKRVVHADK